MDSEPALTVTAVTSAVAAVIVLLVAFGVDISTDQKEAILGVVGVVYVVATPLLVRAKVISPATDAERSKQAYLDGVGGDAPSVPVGD